MTPGSRKPRVARNEGKACDAVVRYVEQRTGDARAAIRRPETDRISPPVDFRLMIGAREYAIEHTQIEAIPGLIRADQKYIQLIGPIIDEDSGTLPGPAVYGLHFPIDTHLGVKRADLARIQWDLIAWIQAEAQCLYEGNRDRLEQEQMSPRYLDSIEATPPGFPYPVRLCIRPARSRSKRGTLQAARLDLAEEKREVRRANRLREALNRKCPKLQRCKVLSTAHEPSSYWRATISPSRTMSSSANVSPPCCRSARTCRTRSTWWKRSWIPGRYAA